ncbi:MAG: DUF3298 domain-containing protein [Bacteroidales bacterium]|nr:DUF3298 domain-containing protein [Bacteroidales bacterium]
MKRIFLFLSVAALCMVAACTREMKIATAADEGKIDLEGYEGFGCSWSYSMEYVTAAKTPEIADNINRAIIQSALYSDLTDKAPVISTCCQQWVEGIKTEYDEFAGEILPELDEGDEPWMMNWSYTMDGSFTTGCASRNLRTYSVMDDSYSGGAHGTTINTFLVFDLTTGRQITEADLFRDGFEEDIAEPLYDKVLENLDEDAWDAIYEVPTPNGNFSVSEQGLTWHYNQYEIAPYVVGPLSAEFTWDELAPYLK